MTRKEEIRAAAVRNTTCYEHQKYYEDGAEWADKHPRKGLWDKEKICKLLANMLVEVTYLDDKSITEHYDKYEFIEDFKKAMEE